MNNNSSNINNYNNGILDNAIMEIKKNKCCNTRYIKAPSETITIKETITANSGEEAKVIDEKVNNNHNLSFIIPKGQDGSSIPNKIASSYIVSFNFDYPSDGKEINIKNRLPLERKELDTDNIIILDSNNNTIKFNKIGHYKINITVNARIPITNDIKNDFITLAFRKIDTDNIYIAGSLLYKNDDIKQINLQGIIAISDINELYELINLSNKSIYLNTPDILNIDSNSYFTNNSITMIIEYLGR